MKLNLSTLEWIAFVLRSLFACAVILYFIDQTTKYGFSVVWLLRAACAVFLCIAMPSLLLYKRSQGREFVELNSTFKKVAFASIWILAWAGLVFLR